MWFKLGVVPIFIISTVFSSWVMAQQPSGGINTSNQALPSVYMQRSAEQENVLRQLTGQIERLQYDLQKVQGQLGALEKDTDFRLVEVERTLNGRSNIAHQDSNVSLPSSLEEKKHSGPTAPLASISAPGSGKRSTLEPMINSGENASNVYKQALNQLRNHDYKGAQSAFQSFLSQYPEHSLTGNVYYWLGESFYARSQYEKSAQYFLDGYRKFPEGNKAPDSLLKLGMSLSALGQHEAACDSFREVEQNYLSTRDNPTFRGVLSREKGKASCS